MAKAQLDILLDTLSGRLTGNSQFYTTQRHGKTVISNYPLHKDPKTISARQKELNASFAQAVKQAKLEMSNPDRLAYWTERYEAYKKAANKNLANANADFFGTPSDKYYSTLRGFIIAQLRNKQ